MTSTSEFGQAHAALASKLNTSMSLINGNRSRTGTMSFEAPEVFLNPKKKKVGDSEYEYPGECVFGIGLHPDTLAVVSIIASVKNGERPTLLEEESGGDSSSSY